MSHFWFFSRAATIDRSTKPAAATCIKHPDCGNGYAVNQRPSSSLMHFMLSMFLECLTSERSLFLIRAPLSKRFDCCCFIKITIGSRSVCNGTTEKCSADLDFSPKNVQRKSVEEVKWFFFSSRVVSHPSLAQQFSIHWNVTSLTLWEQLDR